MNIQKIENEQILQLANEVNSLAYNSASGAVRMEEIYAMIKSGFPNGDLEGHCRYHQNVIEWQELRSQLVRAALIKAAQSGGVIAFGWICYALWNSFKYGVTH